MSLDNRISQLMGKLPQPEVDLESLPVQDLGETLSTLSKVGPLTIQVLANIIKNGKPRDQLGASKIILQALSHYDERVVVMKLIEQMRADYTMLKEASDKCTCDSAGKYY